MTGAAFATTTDTTNGYSGAPVLDDQGRLVGINVTVVGGINPQERYGSHAVGVAQEQALARLGLQNLRARVTVRVDMSGVDAWLDCQRRGDRTDCQAASAATNGGRIAEAARSSFATEPDERADPKPERVAALVRAVRTWRLDSLGREVAAFLPRPTPGKVQVFVVANGHRRGDAYVRAHRGEPVIVLNALVIAATYRGNPEAQARSALGVVRHETFHALFSRHRASAPSWRSTAPDGAVGRLWGLVLEEGVAHLVDRREELMRDGLPRERATRALEELARAVRLLPTLPAESPQAPQLLARAGEGSYWEKYGAISGLVLAYGVYRTLGIPGIREALRCGPGRLLKLYRDARELEPGLPRLSGELMQAGSALRPGAGRGDGCAQAGWEEGAPRER